MLERERSVDLCRPKKRWQRWIASAARRCWAPEIRTKKSHRSLLSEMELLPQSPAANHHHVGRLILFFRAKRLGPELGQPS
ncbi:hypothetical protein RHMOL_Rhmol05G0193700 [Rhododendron molle]|uniref:Uncharacterized protein n=1 Tax=Rhododendron molle TaxID=49168 RepID=A0ACC0NRS5_RHOML|nr:hypothetical protein RHMOL_Rhmol05G0193700 [Rhododendron molle]